MPRFIAPVDSPITQGWGDNPDYYKQFGEAGHTGIDYGAPIGTPIRASADGTVKFAGIDTDHPNIGFMSIAGKAVLIDHGDVFTGYCHLSEIEVGIGQHVKQGDIIGKTGDTGVVTGPHIHFEFWGKPTNFKNGWAGRVDPSNYLVKGENMPELVNLDTARILANGCGTSDGFDGRPAAHGGQRDDDLNKNHVGQALTNEYIINNWWKSQEASDKLGIVRAVYAERDALRQEVAKLKEQLNDQGGDYIKVSDLYVRK